MRINVDFDLKQDKNYMCVLDIARKYDYPNVSTVQAFMSISVKRHGYNYYRCKGNRLFYYRIEDVAEIYKKVTTKGKRDFMTRQKKKYFIAKNGLPVPAEFKHAKPNHKHAPPFKIEDILKDKSLIIKKVA
jgi:hypothetical protein